MVCVVCSAARLSTPAPSEPLPHLSDSANQLPSAEGIRGERETDEFLLVLFSNPFFGQRIMEEGFDAFFNLVSLAR